MFLAGYAYSPRYLLRAGFTPLWCCQSERAYPHVSRRITSHVIVHPRLTSPRPNLSFLANEPWRRAKDSWTDRERRNLTPTDVALGAKRSGKGGRGWRTKPGGSKVFVAPARGAGATVVASGQAAFRMSMSGRKKRVG